MEVRNLDFAVIGAQKCATTSLRMYLSKHPGIQLPRRGEAPFFSEDTLYERGWEEFARKEFAPNTGRRILGKVTPHYMMDGRVPDRIAALVPEVKLVAILRDPVERAFSHYRMCVRRGDEKRSFTDAVNDLLRDDVPAVAGGQIPPRCEEPRMYLKWGMYGRILETYLENFSRKQVLVVFSEDLAERPGHVMGRIFDLIGADPGSLSEDFRRRYHTSEGEESLLKARENPFVYCLSRVVPRGLRPGLRAAASGHLNSGSDGTARESKREEGTREALSDFFREDVERLADMFSITVPWKGYCCTV